MKKISKLDLSIILVNWNCGKVIYDCLDSIIKTVKKHSYEIMVVDNDSKDGSPETIRKRYPKVKLIRNNFNNMFAGANNQGYKASKGEYIFILNSDTIVAEGAVDGLVTYLEKNKKDVVTCKLLNKDGSVQYNMHRGFPSFLRLATGYLYKKYNVGGFLPSVKHYLLIDNKFNKDFYVDQAAGAAILLSRKLVDRLGYLFDEKNFPLFYNDVDLCYRIHKKGIRIICKTDFAIYHIKGNSIKKVSSYNHIKTYLSSVIRFFLKNKLLLFKPN